MKKSVEDRLLNCKSLHEFLAMFFGLGIKDKLSVFTEDVPIKKRTKLYRIRRAEGIKNPNDLAEWEPVPKSKAKQGRFNRDGQSVLYVATEASILGREIGLKEKEEYYLATYVCKEDFKVGSFFGVNSWVNMLLHKIAMSVSDSSDLYETENTLIERYFDINRHCSLVELAKDMLASMYIYKLLPNLYDVTNELGELVMKKNDCGIRYASVYVPIECSGTPAIITFDGAQSGNYVLTQKGFNNIKLLSVEKKEYEPCVGLELMIETFANQR